MGFTSHNAELAKLSDVVYDGTPNIPGYQFLDASPANSSGMFAAAYRETATNKVVVVFRGTALSDLGDIVADGALKFGAWHPQFDDAIKFVAAVADEFLGGVKTTSATNLIVTGHSLGGALAQITGQLFGADGAAFDPVGAVDQIGMQQFRDAAQQVGIDPATRSIAAAFRNYAVEGSLASSAAACHVGQVCPVPQMYYPDVLDILKSLAVSAVLKSNPILAVLGIAAIDQVDYKHDMAKVLDTVTRLGKLEDTLGGQEVRCQKDADGNWQIFDGNGVSQGSFKIEDGQLLFSDPNGQVIRIGAEQAALGETPTVQNGTLVAAASGETLIGLSGNDILRSDVGNVALIGGSGNDTYYATEGDTIRDSDGKGTVYLNGKQLTFATRKAGESVWKDTAGNTYALNNGKLEINDPLVIEGFDNGELGIYLDEEEDPDAPPKPPAYNPNNAIIRRIDPLVLDLDGNGQIDAVGSTASTVYFDFNGDNVAERAGWIAAQDGMLSLDANANGVIDGLDELFGSNQIDGFAELAGHDGNGDGKIDTADDDFVKLRVWRDANQDGVSQADELKTLIDLGITDIDLATTTANTAVADNLVTAIGSFAMNGETHLAADIHLAVNFALTDSNPNRPLGLPPTLDAEVFGLPWLRGYGNVKSLPVAYQENPALRQAAGDKFGTRGEGLRIKPTPLVSVRESSNQSVWEGTA